MSRHREPCTTCGHHKQIYSLSCDDYDALLERSGNRCERCGIAAEDATRGVLHIDHDTWRGQTIVRGLLCSRCNTNLGRGGSWIDESSRAYLKRAELAWVALGYRSPELAKADRYAETSLPNTLRLVRLSEQARCSQEQADRDRAERNALILEVLDKGVESQAAVCRAVGLTREQVRRIVEAERKRHVEPDPPTPGQP